MGYKCNKSDIPIKVIGLMKKQSKKTLSFIMSDKNNYFICKDNEFLEKLSESFLKKEINHTIGFIQNTTNLIIELPPLNHISDMINPMIGLLVKYQYVFETQY